MDVSYLSNDNTKLDSNIKNKKYIGVKKKQIIK